MKRATLCVCRGFLPNEITDALDCHFFFVNEKTYDPISLIEVARAYFKIIIEKQIYDFCKEDIAILNQEVVVIENLNQDTHCEKKETKVAFLASSDTHVQFMQKLAHCFDSYIYIIPALHCKDDSAAAALQREGEKYIELDYHATECTELLNFNPKYIFCAADWTSEFIAIKRVIEGTGIKCIALQEGPQDWHCKFWDKSQFKVQNHYRNADIIFATGAKTFNYIRPKYFAVTGNPKMPILREYSLPDKPKVLINCNFTYVRTKPAYESTRDVWMNSVLRVCKKIGIDYIISKHPRDDSEWPGEPVINSNAYVIGEQLMSCSVCISRFSSISYEAAAYGRKSIYYNIALEPMATFQDEMNPYIPCVTEEDELERVLREHIASYPTHIDYEAAEKYLTRHNAKLDGHARDRIIDTMMDICINKPTSMDILKQSAGIIKHDKVGSLVESYLDEKNNVLIVLRNDRSNDFRKGMHLAEKMAEAGKNVFVAIDSYPLEYDEYMKYEGHQRIEFIPTRDYLIDISGLAMGQVVVAKSIQSDTGLYHSVQKSLNNDATIFTLNNVSMLIGFLKCFLRR